MPSTAPGRPTSGGQRLVVGVDGSASGAAALAWALRQAVLLTASVDAVACWQVPAVVSAGYGSYTDFSAFDQTAPITEMLDGAVAAAVRDVRGAETVPVRPHVLEEHPVRALLRFADGADLLVVGSRGHGELRGVLLGSVGLHCVTHARCPVVVVRAARPGASSSVGDPA